MFTHYIPKNAILTRMEVKQMTTPTSYLHLVTGLNTIYCKLTFKLPQKSKIQESLEKEEEEHKQTQFNYLSSIPQSPTSARLEEYELISNQDNINNNIYNNIVSNGKEFTLYISMIKYPNIITEELKFFEEKLNIFGLIAKTIFVVPIVKSAVTIKDIEQIIKNFNGQSLGRNIQQKMESSQIVFSRIQTYFENKLHNVSPQFCMHLQLNLQLGIQISEKLLVHKEVQIVNLIQRILAVGSCAFTLHVLKQENWKKKLYGIALTLALCQELKNALLRYCYYAGKKYIQKSAYLKQIQETQIDTQNEFVFYEGRWEYMIREEDSSQL